MGQDSPGDVPAMQMQITGDDDMPLINTVTMFEEQAHLTRDCDVHHSTRMIIYSGRQSKPSTKLLPVYKVL